MNVVGSIEAVAAAAQEVVNCRGYGNIRRGPRDPLSLRPPQLITYTRSTTYNMNFFAISRTVKQGCTYVQRAYYKRYGGFCYNPPRWRFCEHRFPGENLQVTSLYYVVKRARAPTAAYRHAAPARILRVHTTLRTIVGERRRRRRRSVLPWNYF